MTARLSCPYCDNAVNLADLPASRRVVCSRCGESFHVPEPTTKAGDSGSPLHPESLNGVPQSSSAPSPTSSADEYPAPPLRAMWTLGMMGLTFALIVFSIGIYAIYRGYPNRKQQEPIETVPSKLSSTMPPVAVRGLNYLPKDANVAFAIQPSALLTYAERNKLNPNDLLTQAGVPPVVFKTLDEMGVKLEQIQSLVGGVTLGNDTLIPRVVVVLTLRSKLADPDAFLKQLKAQSAKTVTGGTRYKVTVASLPMELAMLDSGPYLFATDAADLETKTTNTDHLASGLKESMGKLSPSSFVWLATDSDDWAKKPSVNFGIQALKQPQLTAQLATIRAAAIGVSLEPDLQLLVGLRGADLNATQSLEARARGLLTSKSPTSTVMPTVQKDGNWLSTSLPFTAKDGLSGLRELLPAPPKK